VPWLLGDTENHHARGVHDADDDLGEPDAGIGEMSPGIGKAPDHRSLHSTSRLACSSWGPGGPPSRSVHRCGAHQPAAVRGHADDSALDLGDV
jgi:hypothetical protein